mgnify:FL=1
MARSQETFNKKDVRSKQEKKKKEKEKKRLLRKENVKSGNFEDMIAYVDENGMITNTPPDPTKKQKVELESIEIGIPKRDNTEKTDPIRKGTVIFYNDSKGYGFIKDAATQQSIFVHANNLMDPIKENNTVTFETEKGKKGLTAVRVKLLK